MNGPESLRHQTKNNGLSFEALAQPLRVDKRSFTSQINIKKAHAVSAKRRAERQAVIKDIFEDENEMEDFMDSMMTDRLSINNVVQYFNQQNKKYRKQAEEAKREYEDNKKEMKELRKEISDLKKILEEDLQLKTQIEKKQSEAGDFYLKERSRFLYGKSTG